MNQIRERVSTGAGDANSDIALNTRLLSPEFPIEFKQADKILNAKRKYPLKKGKIFDRNAAGKIVIPGLPMNQS